MNEPQIATRDGGNMDYYLSKPTSGTGPGIVLLQEIFGVNDAMRKAADEFADAGYVVVAPDLFWRLERNVRLNYSDTDRQQAFGYWQQFDLNQGVEDVASAYEFLQSSDLCTSPVAIVGFCLGGQLATLAAAKTAAAAVISFYGVKPGEYLDTIAALNCPFQFHVGSDDPHVPMSVVEEVQAATSAKANAEVFVYEDATHGFYNSVRSDVFAPQAAAQAKARTLELLSSIAAK